MKILLIQLARPGDIFCTWPVLSALRRQNPQAEIHFLVRKKFASCCMDFHAVNHFWHFDSQKWLTPLLEDSCKINEATEILNKTISSLRSENFDEIINLSFSPSSSFITHLITSENTLVRGYTRTQDFYLHIPDEASRYFKSQVGIEKSNRIHVNDLFAMVANTEITDGDLSLYNYFFEKSKVICHIGASVRAKTWPAESWSDLINSFTTHGKEVILVGSPAEEALAEEVLSKVLCPLRVENTVGKTSFADLARIIASAQLFIGADSGPMHVANSVGTPTLNLSLGAVNFWETGPTVKGSQVLVSRNPSNLYVHEVFMTAFAMLEGKQVNINARICDGQKLVRYDDRGLVFDHGWEMIQWKYFGGAKPKLSSSQEKFSVQIYEVCLLATQQLEVFRKDPKKVESLSIMERVDEILKIIEKTDRALAPLIAAFFCEKENILPCDQTLLINETSKCYENLITQIQSLITQPNQEVSL